jgi:hypothetical protein
LVEYLEARLYEVIVKGTYEEAESKRRKEALKALFEQLVSFSDSGV